MLLEALLNEGLDVQALARDLTAHAQDFAAAPPAVARVMRDVHLDTWFTRPGSTKCFATTRGSRPGSPIADLA